MASPLIISCKSMRNVKPHECIIFERILLVTEVAIGRRYLLILEDYHDLVIFNKNLATSKRRMLRPAVRLLHLGANPVNGYSELNY